MTKNQAIELAERYKALGLNAESRWDRAMFLNTAGHYYREAGQYSMVIWCRENA